MAEKIITLGKKGTNVARSNAQAFLMPAHHYTTEAFNAPVTPTLPPAALESADPEAFVPNTSLLPKVFGPLARRYADRPGGYTRIQRFGKRPGDNAPVAILSLVDGPRDLKFEMTARAAARETLTSGVLPRTRRSMDRVLKYRGDEGKAEFKRLQQDYSVSRRGGEEARCAPCSHACAFMSAPVLTPAPPPRRGRRILPRARTPARRPTREVQVPPPLLHQAPARAQAHGWRAPPGRAHPPHGSWDCARRARPQPQAPAAALCGRGGGHHEGRLDGTHVCIFIAAHAQLNLHIVRQQPRSAA